MTEQLFEMSRRPCSPKVRWATKRQALTGLTSTAYAYRCRHCDGWHATTKENADV